MRECEECQGLGYIVVTIGEAYHHWYGYYLPVESEERCPVCKGYGVVEDEEEVRAMLGGGDEGNDT
jgi:DnaJ-class molecular chaperone